MEDEKIEYEITIAGFDPVRVFVDFEPKSTQRYRAVAMVAAQLGLLQKYDITSIWEVAKTRKVNRLPASGGRPRNLPFLMESKNEEERELCGIPL